MMPPSVRELLKELLGILNFTIRNVKPTEKLVQR